MPKLHLHRLVWALALAGAGPLAGCSSGGVVPADVRVPPDLLRGSPYTATGENGHSRYVVRMTDGQRDWEIQLPEIATAYEVKVPLSGRPASMLSPDMAPATEADREIMAENEAERRARAATTPGPDDTTDETAGAGGGARPG
ncbi:MAG TPA: hypothetical protein VHO06_21630, partial [Polyangia bacterium]|nr:hypothetical protein [Polyangia bacterium]